MEFFQKLIRNSKDYFKGLKKDIKEFDFSIKSLKELVIRRKVLICIILFSFLFLGISYGNYRFSKNILLNNLEIALKENKPRKIYKDMFIDEESISKNDLKPLCSYYFQKDSLVNNIIKDLKNGGESEFIKLIETNSLFNKYRLEIKTVDLTLNSNFEKTEFYLNDKKLENNVANKIIPGKYVVKGELETVDGTLIEEKEIFILDSMKYEINMPAININLTSNFDDAKVYINDKDINKKVSDIKNYGPISLNKDTSIQLERNFPWGTIKSEKINIEKIPNININIDISNDTLIKEIELSLNEFYNSVFEALNKRDYTLIKNCEDDTKNRIYNDIKKESLFLKNNYDLKDLSIEIKNSEFYYENETYKANIITKLKYKVSKKLLPFIGKEIEEIFLTNLEYIDGTWKIMSIQKISLE